MLNLSASSTAAYLITTDQIIYKAIEINEFNLNLIEQAISKNQGFAADNDTLNPSSFWDDIAVRVSQTIAQSLHAGLAKLDFEDPLEDKHPVYVISAGISPAHSGWQFFARMLTKHLPEFDIHLLSIDDAEQKSSTLLARLDFDDLADWVNICSHTQENAAQHPIMLAMAIGGGLAMPSWYQN